MVLALANRAADFRHERVFLIAAFDDVPDLANVRNLERRTVSSDQPPERTIFIRLAPDFRRFLIKLDAVAVTTGTREISVRDLMRSFRFLAWSTVRFEVTDWDFANYRSIATTS